MVMFKDHWSLSQEEMSDNCCAILVAIWKMTPIRAQKIFHVFAGIGPFCSAGTAICAGEEQMDV